MAPVGVGDSVEVPAHKQLFETVPVAEVNCENLEKIWLTLIDSIKNAQLVAVDLVSFCKAKIQFQIFVVSVKYYCFAFLGVEWSW